jgi:iron-sulfur cluster repair protein YtfE (RIC family)
MIPITQALIAEHQMFGVVFEQVEKLLPSFERLEEVRRAARMVEGLLLSHAELEENLLMLAQEHVPQDARRYELCRKEHQEIDSRLTRVRSTRRIAQARSLLRGAMAASRKHFKREERRVFPLIEKGMQLQTLTKLGTVWFLHRYAPANWTI